MPNRDVDVAMRRTPGVPRYQTRVVANLENLEEFTSLVIIPTGSLRIRIGIMGSGAQHEPGVRSVHDIRTKPVGGQRYGRIGDMIEVGEVFAEVFKRKKVIGRNREYLSPAKPEDISESLLYPELSDGRLGLSLGRSGRVKRSELGEQSLALTIWVQYVIRCKIN